MTHQTIKKAFTTNSSNSKISSEVTTEDYKLTELVSSVDRKYSASDVTD